jgi:hypothetical protein
MRMRKILGNNRGWAMALVIVLLAVIPIFVVALYTYSSTSTKLVLKQINLERARYLARSGMEAAVYVWQDATLDAKPTGSLERVYLTADGTFARQSTISADDISNSHGYVDVTITFNNDSSSDEYLTTKIISSGIADETGSEMTATSLPYMDGDSTGWYNDNSGEFNTSNGDITNSITSPYSATVRYFDLEGVVTCDTKDKDGFTFQSGVTGILVDTIFFNDVVDVATGADKLLFITAKKVIFRDEVHLSDGTDYLVLHASKLNAIEIEGKTGKYGAVYFRGNVDLDGITIIPAGTNFYYAAGGDGIDIIAWSKLTAEEKASSTDFWLIPTSGDDNAFTPTEASSIYFIYE